MEIRVYYEDTDSGGVVYYANYLNYFERARTEFFRERGVCFAEHDARGILFVVAHVEIDYRASARHDDVLLVETEPIDSSRVSFTLAHRIVRKSDGMLLAEGKVRQACVGPDGRPRRLPDALRRIVEETG